MTRTVVLCMAFAAASLSGVVAHGFCVEHPLDANGQPVAKAYWATKPIKFRIHDTGSASGPLGASVQPDKNSEFAAVRAAFAEWAAAECADIQFQDDGLIPATEPVNLQHTANEIRVYWARTTDEWGLASRGPIARTWFNHDGTGKITSAAILINAIDKPFSTVGAGDKYDVQSVVATEVGRVLGLAGVNDPNSVMYPSFSMGSTAKRQLSPDDAAGAAYLYPGGAAEDGGTCSPGTPDTNCQSTPPQDGGVTPQDGGGGQSDGGASGEDGGVSGDGGSLDGGQYCNSGNDCPSGICDVNHQCVPAPEDDGCSCRVGGAEGRWALGALLLLALGLVLVRRRMSTR